MMVNAAMRAAGASGSESYDVDLIATTS